MEVPNIPIKPTVSKTEASRVEQAKRKAANAYGGAAAGDSLDISSKGRLLQKLKTAYSTLEPTSNKQKVEELKQKVAVGGTINVSPEELVNSILQGTLFDV